MSERRYVCTLDPSDVPARRAQGEEMVRRLRTWSRLEDGLELGFDASAGTERLVEEFVRDEKQCCGFFSFEIDRDPDGVVLRMRAPREPGAQEMVDAALETFVGEL